MAREQAIASGRRRERERPVGEMQATILQAAHTLLERMPAEELTAQGLIDEAGISRGSFYHYFESKHAVIAALLEQVLDEVLASSTRWLERGSTPPETAVREGLKESVEVWRRHGPLLRAAIHGSRSVPQLIEGWRALMDEFIDAAAARIDSERASGAAPQDSIDPRTLASVLTWMNEQALSMAIADPALPMPEDEQLVDALATVWTRAIYGTK